jgi:hypothetical protein
VRPPALLAKWCFYLILPGHLHHGQSVLVGTFVGAFTDRQKELIYFPSMTRQSDLSLQATSTGTFFSKRYDR